MHNRPNNFTDLRMLLPEEIWLEPEYFNEAREISNQVETEAKRWQTYINALGLFGFEHWVSDRLSKQLIHRDISNIETVGNLQVNEFKICLIATEHLLDEVVNIPQDTIEEPELVTHFYVVLEVLEEQEEIIIKGFLRYDQLVNDLNNFILQDGYYQIPLSLFDVEPNHLLFYCQFLAAAAIPIPVAATTTKVEAKLLGKLKETRIKLSQWLQGVFDEGWQTIDTLISMEASLALSTRNTQERAKRCKLINLGMEIGSQTVVLLVNITEDIEDKLAILIQLHPTGGERYLPPNLKLTLQSKAGKTLQEVQSRGLDNYIQLKPFKGEPGKRFTVEISLNDVSLKEDFEI